MLNTAADVNSVLLVEDDAETRKRLAAVIAVHPQLVLQAVVSTCADARKLLSSHPS